MKLLNAPGEPLHKKRELGELGIPRSHGCKQRRVQRLLGHSMRRGGQGIERGFQALTELCGVKKWESGVADLEEDLDKVKRKSMSGIAERSVP